MPSYTNNKGCWTCKDRKIACDKRLPFCVKCEKAGRQCLGYGTRLSWPRDNDRRRAIVSQEPRCSKMAFRPHPRNSDYLNVFYRDVELSYELTGGAGSKDPCTERNEHYHWDVMPKHSAVGIPRLAFNPSWMPITLNNTHLSLVSYFDKHLAMCLSPIQNARVRDLTLRMAFEDGSPASYAILCSISALSSLHLKDTVHAVEYKRKALSAVWASASQTSDTKSVLQRIIAVNFVACFETYANPNVSIDWAVAICYAKTAAINTYAADQTYIGDLALILDWVFYYDVISRFAVRHFDRRFDSMLVCARKQHLMWVEMNSPDKTYIVPTLGCSLEVLNAIASIIDVVLEIEAGSDPDHEVFDRLERRLRYAKQDIRFEETDGPQSTNTAAQASLVAELHRLAGMIYLHRAARQSLCTNPTLQRLVDDAFGVMEHLETCDRPLPLFVVGCEARRDDQRAIVLNLISRTQVRYLMNIVRVRKFLERFWAQDDLDIDQSIDYAAKVTAVLSSSEMLPAFS
ncbi:fungal-specific transcription factor domain-containing protein [Lophiotrema nucula]|uniref:Fungal-specific transcription factor domain-containing protein n=1 Tax=Lophiotrema nucula TaxID=690887 RepID=A0A6A5YJ24_9PLEO|nr:fungal-specific transcription factor domain-containing protein [Lophiotrema nucula]